MSSFEKNWSETLWEFLPGIVKVLSILGIFVLLFQIISLASSGPDGYKLEPDLVRDYNAIQGPKQAKVQLIYFFDMQCPQCKNNNPVIKEVSEKYKDRVQFVYRHFPLESIHAYARIAGRALQAAGRQGEDKYFAYKDSLFERQNELSPDTLNKVAQEVGLDMDKWNKDRNSAEVAQEVEWDRKDAENMVLPANERGEIKTSGTPTTVIKKDGEVVYWYSGIRTTEDLSAKLDEYLK